MSIHEAMLMPKREIRLRKYLRLSQLLKGNKVMYIIEVVSMPKLRELGYVNTYGHVNAETQFIEKIVKAITYAIEPKQSKR